MCALNALFYIFFVLIVAVLSLTVSSDLFNSLWLSSNVWQRQKPCKKRPVTGLQAAFDGVTGIKALTAAFTGD